MYRVRVRYPDNTEYNIVVDEETLELYKEMEGVDVEWEEIKSYGKAVIDIDNGGRKERVSVIDRDPETMRRVLDEYVKSISTSGLKVRFRLNNGSVIEKPLSEAYQFIDVYHDAIQEIHLVPIHTAGRQYGQNDKVEERKTYTPRMFGLIATVEYDLIPREFVKMVSRLNEIDV